MVFSLLLETHSFIWSDFSNMSCFALVAKECQAFRFLFCHLPHYICVCARLSRTMLLSSIAHSMQIVMFYSFNAFSIGKMYLKLMHGLQYIFLLDASFPTHVLVHTLNFFLSAPFCHVCLHQAIWQTKSKVKYARCERACSHKNANMNTRAELNRKLESDSVVVVVKRTRSPKKRQIAAFHSFEVILGNRNTVAGGWSNVSEHHAFVFARQMRGFRREKCPTVCCLLIASHKNIQLQFRNAADVWNGLVVTCHHQMRWHSILLRRLRRSSILISIFRVRELVVAKGLLQQQFQWKQKKI